MGHNQDTAKVFQKSKKNDELGTRTLNPMHSISEEIGRSRAHDLLQCFGIRGLPGITEN